MSVMDGHAAVKTLEAELKLLRWHKLANESALKAAILKDKQMKRRDESVPRILNDSKIRLAAVIEDERSKDLLTDEAFVRKQEEYKRKDEAAAHQQQILHTKRLHDMQSKAEKIRLSRIRKQKCLQIKAAGCTDDSTGDAANCEAELRSKQT